MAFCPVPPATPTKTVTNEGQTVATVHPQPKPADNSTQPSHCVAGYSDGTVRLFDLGRVEMIMKMQPHAVATTAIAFSADGKTACSYFRCLIIVLPVLWQVTNRAYVGAGINPFIAMYLCPN